MKTKKHGLPERNIYTSTYALDYNMKIIIYLNATQTINIYLLAVCAFRGRLNAWKNNHLDLM